MNRAGGILQAPALFTLFFFSGFCSLLYQIVWCRLAFAAFGVITPVLSVVISVFMAGLAVGSYGAGRWVAPLAGRLGTRPLILYGAAEAGIGFGAFAVPWLFDLGRTLLLPAGEIESVPYLLFSALVLAISLFPWCVCMGATFPLMMAHVRQIDPGHRTSFSFLYLGNVLGAMAGTALTAIVLIEILGFRGTLVTAGLANAGIAAAAWWMGRRLPAGEPSIPESSVPGAAAGAIPPRQRVVILFLTGFVSMAMEVVWTRGFTPVLTTQVYAFSSLLFMYLLATSAGSWMYRRQVRSGRVPDLDPWFGWLSFAAVVPALINDVRLHASVPLVLLSIAPFCAILGYVTPRVIDEHAGGHPAGAGRAYAVNVVGCILGPPAASYVFLPLLGVRGSILLLALPLLVFFIRRRQTISLAGAAAAAALAVSALEVRMWEEAVPGSAKGAWIRRDSTATVIAFGSGIKKQLLVNGVGMTHLTPITKFMSHAPLCALARPPESVLVLCFGMGTAWRSALSWNCRVTAVELVPSVRDVFPYYYEDAERWLRDPRGRIVIDDARRFLRRTGESYDVITIDPPPPVEAAGSSLLYSVEFYELVKSRLKPGGVVQQWCPGGEKAIVFAMARSISDRFAHVRVFRGIEGWGFHFLASADALKIGRAEELVERMPPAAREDLIEWMAPGFRDPALLMRAFLRSEVRPETLLDPERDVRITDDNPFNEYFLLRRMLSGWYW